MRRAYLYVVGAAAVCIANFPSPARAQGVFNMGQLTNTLSMGSSIKSEESRAKKTHGGSASKDHTQTAGNLGVFTPSSSARKHNMDLFIAGIRKSDPPGADALKKVFNSSDIYGLAGKWMENYGLKSNRVADVIATYLTSAWLAARGSNADPTKKQIVAVRDQIRLAMGNTSAFTTANDSQKQQMADSLLLYTAYMGSLVNSAKGHPERMSEIKSAVAQGARASFQIDLNAVKLTDQGFRFD